MAKTKKKTGNVSEGVIKVAFSDLPIIEGSTVIQGKILLSDNLRGEDANTLLQMAMANTSSPIQVLMPGIFSCHGGNIDLKINGENFRLKENSIIFLKSGNLLESVHGSDDAKYTLVSFNPVTPKGNRLPTNSDISFSKILLMSSDPLHLDTDKTVADAYCSLYCTHKQLISYVDENYVEDLILGFISACSSIMATWTAKQIPDVKVMMDKKNYVFHAFIDNIHKHASQYRDVAFYADKACMSPKYFSDMISAFTGKPPSFWIKDYVILETKALLKSGLYSIKQVSDKMSFPNPSFFCKYFKSSEGITPGQFIKQGL